MHSENQTSLSGRRRRGNLFGFLKGFMPEALVPQGNAKNSLPQAIHHLVSESYEEEYVLDRAPLLFCFWLLWLRWRIVPRRYPLLCFPLFPSDVVRSYEGFLLIRYCARAITSRLFYQFRTIFSSWTLSLLFLHSSLFRETVQVSRILFVPKMPQCSKKNRLLLDGP